MNKKTKDVQPIKQVHFRKQWEQQGDTMHPPPEALYHPPEVRGEETPLQDYFAKTTLTFKGLKQKINNKN